MRVLCAKKHNLLLYLQNINLQCTWYIFEHKKHSDHSIKLRINHWRHMYYFNDIFTTFLGLESGSCAIDYQSSDKKLSDFIKIP